MDRHHTYLFNLLSFPSAKNAFLYSTLLFLLLFIRSSSFGSPFQTKTTTGIIIDESGVPVPNANVSVAGSEFYLSDSEGKFKISLTKKLTLPFKVVVIKEGYQLKTFTLLDSEEEIEIVVKKISQFTNREIMVRFVDENQKGIAHTNVSIDGYGYKTDRKGIVPVDNPIAFSKKSKISIEGYDVQSTLFIQKENAFEVSASKKLVVETVKELPILEATDSLSAEKLNQKVYKEYKDGFEEVTKELIAEQIRVEGNNEKIRNEILGITKRLENEKNLNPEQRKELNRQVEKMEIMVLENTKAFQKSQERTNLLILKLKSAINEKDLIYEQALKKIALIEKEKRITERKFKRNLIIFSIITVTLLLLAVVFYSIARKMRNHRKELMASNQEMLGIKEQLAKKVEELNAQNQLIEEQKKQLSNR